MGRPELRLLDVVKIKEAFDKFDTDGSGEIEEVTKDQVIQALQIDNVNLRTQNNKLWECVDFANAETLSERERTGWAEALVDVVGSEAMKRVVLQEERASEFHARLPVTLSNANRKRYDRANR